jgi:hypothetical protein
MQTLAPRPQRQIETPQQPAGLLAQPSRRARFDDFVDCHDLENPLVLEYRGVCDGPPRRAL